MEMCELCFSDVPRVSRVLYGSDKAIYTCDLCRRVAPRGLLKNPRTDLSNAELLMAMLRLGNELLIAMGKEVQE